MKQTQITIGFVLAWILLLFLTIETRLSMFRMLIPVLAIAFVVYLLIATIMYMCSSPDMPAKDTETEDIEEAELVEDEPTGENDGR